MEQKSNNPTWSEETGKSGPPRILFTSVYGPYAQPGLADAQHTFSMELFNNQVTCGQGVFSPRTFHNSFGIRMIQANLKCPSILLDFPNLERFEKELRSTKYDIIGISSIVMNLDKVKKMCESIRRISPQSKIVVGGHIASFNDAKLLTGADHIVRGDGIRWMRSYLGEVSDAPISHPPLRSSFGYRLFGLKFPDSIATTCATIVPSVGCPMGCKFCTTSAFFGGKGKSVVFLKTGKELYEAMCLAESALNTKEFFIMDENFLLDKKRAMELLDFMKKNNKPWSFQVFSSCNALAMYTMDELIQLGIISVWIGLESPSSTFAKLQGSDTKKLVRELRSNGIKVICSTIIGLEHHTSENVAGDVQDAVSHKADFHQFMLYIPFPGTQLYSELEREGRLLKNVDLTGFSGLDRFSFKHDSISREESNRLIKWAFKLDFEQNGPSFFRMIETIYNGCKKYGNHPDDRIRNRYVSPAVILKYLAGPFLWSMERLYEEKDNALVERMRILRHEMGKDYGFIFTIMTNTLGRVLLYTARREEERLEKGVTYEPPTFVEKMNWEN